jgi:hypothetical protein
MENLNAWSLIVSSRVNIFRRRHAIAVVVAAAEARNVNGYGLGVRGPLGRLKPLNTSTAVVARLDTCLFGW